MDSDNPTLKWSLAGVGVVVVCFCLGYFVLGTKGTTEPAAPVQATPSPAATPGSLQVVRVEDQPLQVEDITVEKEAERKRKEEAEKAKKEAKLKEEAAKAAATPAPDETTTSEEEPVNTDTDKAKTDEEKAQTEAVATPAPDDEKTKPKTDEEKPKPADEEKAKPKADPEKTKAPAEKEPSSKSLYRVRVGDAKLSREDAERLAAELRGRGYASSIIADQRKGKTVFHVQAGAFSDADGAERRKKELENNGYDARIN